MFPELSFSLPERGEKGQAMVNDPNHLRYFGESSEIEYGFPKAPVSHTVFSKCQNLINPHGVDYRIITAALTHVNPQLYTTPHPQMPGPRV